MRIFCCTESWPQGLLAVAQGGVEYEIGFSWLHSVGDVRTRRGEHTSIARPGERHLPRRMRATKAGRR